MTLDELTAADIAAVLPTVSTGRAMGDWTEPDDRHTDAEWIRDTVIRAAERRNQVDKHHTTPETGNRNTAPLPPPKPGTHESDLYPVVAMVPYLADNPEDVHGFKVAMEWSRANR